MATDLYSVISGLEVNSDEILQAELIAEKILEAKYPDLDLRQGTGLRDLVIRPGATLLALVNKAVAYYHSQRSLSDVSDDTPTEIVDKILSNWFMERKAGKKSVVSARLFFASRKNVYVGTDIFFSPDNKKKFYPISSYSVTADTLTYDSFSGEYYMDVDLSADKEGSEYDLTSGSLLYFSNFDPYFLRGEISYLRETSSVTETNTQFVSRSKTAVSTRNLINVPSIQNRISEDFNTVIHCTPVGFGEPEMYRDLVQVHNPATESNTQVHLGGKTDVYVKLGLQTSVFQYPTDSNGVATIEGAYYELARSEYSGGDEEDTVPRETTVSVSSLTRSGSVATATSVGHGLLVGDSVKILGATPAGYNATYVITGVTSDTFSFAVSSSLATPATGTITASAPVKFTVDYPSLVNKSASVSRVGRTVTVSSNDHGVMVGHWIYIDNATPATFNGWFKTTSVSRNSFTVTNVAFPNDSSSATATGTPFIRYIDPISDHGLSSRQKVEVDFGPTHANKTASFTLKGFAGIDGLQEYLEQGERRVLCADLLARHFNVYLLDINIIGYNGPAPSSATCYDVAKAYVDSLDPGAPFIMADLISKLNAAGVVTIKTPIEVNYRLFTKYHTPAFEGVILDTLEPDDRTAVFLIDGMTTSNQYL